MNKTIENSKKTLLRLSDDKFTRKLYHTYKDASEHTITGVLVVRVEDLEPSFISMKFIYDRVEKMFALTKMSEYEIFKSILEQIYDASIQFDITIEQVCEEEMRIEKNKL